MIISEITFDTSAGTAGELFSLVSIHFLQGSRAFASLVFLPILLSSASHVYEQVPPESSWTT